MLASKYSICLKARQIGMTWLVVARALHQCLSRDGQLIVGYSVTEDESKDLVNRARLMYSHLPEWMKSRVPLESDAVGRLRWANRSEFRARPATLRAGRSYTATGVILDEWAWLSYAEQLYEAAIRAVEAGGWLVGLSTANGRGGAYYGVWKAAYAGLNDFAAIFLPWWSRPGRDEEWYARQLRNSTDPQVLKQEMPATPEEAFIASGRMRFDQSWIEAQSPRLAAPLPRSAWPARLRALELGRAGNRLDVYELPTPGRIVLGADTAEGVPGGNYDAAVAYDDRTGRVLAVLHGHWDHDTYARLLLETALAVGATLVVERNNHGHAVLLAARHWKDRDPAYRPVPIAAGLDGKPGWNTTASTRPAMLAEVAVVLRDGRISARDKGLLAELADHRVLDDGSTGPSPGGTDDLVLALAVALGYLRLAPSIGVGAVGGPIREPVPGSVMLPTYSRPLI